MVSAEPIPAAPAPAAAPRRFRPDSTEAVAAVLAAASAAGTGVAVIGHGSRAIIGRPAGDADVLDLSGLAGILSYEPEELVISARAGTPVAEIEARLAAMGQHLACEVPDFAALLGTTPGRGTLGGLVATNLCGSRRLSCRSIRDSVLGVTAVTGAGEVFRAGGKVVKNVTGFDIPRLLAGSWGALAVMTEITLGLTPAPESDLTLAFAGLEDAAAVALMTRALGAGVDVAAAAHVPAPAAAALAGNPAGARPVTLLRLEGIAVSVAARAERLIRALADAGAPVRIISPEAGALWRAVRDVIPFAGAQARPVWRVSVAPTRGAELAAAVAAAHPGTDALYDWAGGLVWLRLLEAAADAGAEAVRAAVTTVGGGHATLVRADAETRGRVAVFQPRAPGVAALEARVKGRFDPARILEPGRIVTFA